MGRSLAAVWQGRDGPWGGPALQRRLLSITSCSCHRRRALPEVVRAMPDWASVTVDDWRVSVTRGWHEVDVGLDLLEVCETADAAQAA
jgi:hypothetical protein